MLVEEFQPGVEVEVGVLGNREPIASVVGEIVAHADWYDFDAKYADGGMDLIVPGAPAGARRSSACSSSPSSRSSRPTARGWRGSTSSCGPTARSSSTSSTRFPGFTATSVYAKLFAESGIPYPALLDRLVELALERHEQRQQLDF